LLGNEGIWGNLFKRTTKAQESAPFQISSKSAEPLCLYRSGRRKLRTDVLELLRI